MPADGAQFSPAPTSVTSSGAAFAFGIRAHFVHVVNDTTSAANLFVDFTGGASVMATTSAGYILKNGESRSFSVTSPSAFYSGLSALSSAGNAATLRVLALS